MKAIKTIGIFGAVFAAVLFFGSSQQIYAQRDGNMEWRGTVDDRVNLVIRGRSVRVETISGRRYGNGRSDFDGSAAGWRNRNNGRADVDRLEGRGKVWIVQHPARRNNFTTIVRIEDLKSGPDRYAVRVTWN